MGVSANGSRRHSGRRPNSRLLRTRKLVCELLEDRSLLSATGFGDSAATDADSPEQDAYVANSQVPAAVEVDYGFADDGMAEVLTDPQVINRRMVVLAQADGKIVCVLNGVKDIQVFRFHADGTLDLSFDGDGQATVAIAGNWQTVAAVQADGKIVVANTNWVFRLNADGRPDASFGDQGKVVQAVPGAHSIRRVFALSDGGVAIVGGDHHVFIARLNSDGTPNTGFGQNGVVKHDFGLSPFFMTDAVLQPDGKILLAGRLSVAAGSDKTFLARHNADGSLDASFGQDGIATMFVVPSDCSNDQVASLALAPDGRILVGGISRVDSRRDSSWIACFRPDGSLDTSFDSDGVLIGAFGAPGVPRWPTLLLVQPDGKFLAGDIWFDECTRWNPDGTPDTTFGDAGRGRWCPSDTMIIQIAPVLAPDGSMIVPWYTGRGNKLVYIISRVPKGYLTRAPQDAPVLIEESSESELLAPADSIDPSTWAWQVDRAMDVSEDAQTSPVVIPESPQTAAVLAGEDGEAAIFDGIFSQSTGFSASRRQPGVLAADDFDELLALDL